MLRRAVLRSVPRVPAAARPGRREFSEWASRALASLTGGFTAEAAAAPVLASPAPAAVEDAGPTVMVDVPHVLAASATEGDAGAVADAATTVLNDGTWASMGANLLNDVHSMGVPWWLAIVSTTIVLRFSVMPVSLYSMAMGARFRAVQPEMSIVRKQLSEAQASGQQHHQRATLAKMRDIMKRHNVSMPMMFLPMLIQLPASIIFFWGLRGLCNDAALIPGFLEEGILWIEALDRPDPYYGLPIMQVLLGLATIELNPTFRDPTSQYDQKKMKNVMRAMIGVFSTFTFFFPAGMVLSFVSTSVTMLLQNLLVQMPSIKSAFNFPPGYPFTKPLPPSGMSQAEADAFMAEWQLQQAEQMRNNPLMGFLAKDPNSITANPSVGQAAVRGSAGTREAKYIGWKGLQDPGVPPPPIEVLQASADEQKSERPVASSKPTRSAPKPDAAHDSAVEEPAAGQDGPAEKTGAAQRQTKRKSGDQKRRRSKRKSSRRR